MPFVKKRYRNLNQYRPKNTQDDASESEKPPEISETTKDRRAFCGLSKKNGAKKRARIAASVKNANQASARAAAAAQLGSTSTTVLDNLNELDQFSAPSAGNIYKQGRTHLRRIIFVTGNAKKLEEFRLIMGTNFHIPPKGCTLDLPELQGPSAEAIAREKIREACRVLQPEADDAVICEDTSLCFNALNGLPGSYVKWFLNAKGPEGLYKMVSGLEDHSAYAQCIFGFHGPPVSRQKKGKWSKKCSQPSIYSYDEPTMMRGSCDSCKKRDFNDADRNMRLFVGRCDGNIVEPRGEYAFGWDPCFEPTLPDEEAVKEESSVAALSSDRTKKTFAEMTAEEKNACSHRGRALEQLKRFLCESYVVKKSRINETG